MMVRQDRKSDRHVNRQTPRTFCGVDGEGGQIRGSHEYLLLRAGEFVLETGEPLQWKECLSFIADLPTDRIYISFFFDYDVTMMLRGVREERLRKLLDRDSRNKIGFAGRTLSVDVDSFQIDYLPGKEFKVRRRIAKGVYTKWVVISDVGSFFQCSFVAALKGWFGEVNNDGQWIPETQEIGEVIEQIEIGKQMRNSFGRVTEHEREYNLLEIKMLELLMRRFREVCDSLGLKPRKWQGPGNLVAAQFQRVGMPKTKSLLLFKNNPGLAEFANAAYYGGRFEARTFGWVQGPIRQYDINSAYANTYRRLPCLEHGTWEWTEEIPKNGIFVGDVTFNHKRKLNWYCLPIRTKVGNIVFPRRGRGIYWSPELLSAALRGAEITWHGGYRYRSECVCNYFDWVYDMYAERKRLGKDAKGKVLKIVLASTYGKLAQSVGSAPYANPIHAGLIVSFVREQLIEAALSSPNGEGEDVIMLATDGLFCTEKRDLAIGKDLGEWELTEHDAIFTVQSGVYFLPEKAPKTRGVSQRKVIQYAWQFIREWEKFIAGGKAAVVRIPLRSFIGIRLALARNKPELAGQWVDQERDIAFDWSTKRTKPVITGEHMVTEAPEGSEMLVSVPYGRSIGALGKAMQSREEINDQPDWSDVL